MPGTRALRHTASPARHTFGTEDDTHAGGRVGRDLLGRVVRWVVVDHEDDLEAVLPSVAADVAQDDEHGLEVTLSVDGNGDARIGWERRIAAHARELGAEPLESVGRDRRHQAALPGGAGVGGTAASASAGSAGGRWGSQRSMRRPLTTFHTARSEAALTKQKGREHEGLAAAERLSRSSRPAVPSP